MTPEQLAFELIVIAVRLVGLYRVQELLTQTGINEANAAADAVEDARFPKE